MFPRALTAAQEKECCELYKSGASIKELQELYGCSYPTMRKYLMQNGCWGGARSPITAHYRVCPKCERRCDLDDRFCAKCGHHFKTERELLADALRSLQSDVRSLPESRRDFFQQTLLKAAKVIAGPEG